MPSTSRDPWPLPPIDFALEGSTTALLVIDMQYHNAHPDYGVGRAMAAASPGYGAYFYGRLRTTVIPNICDLIDEWRRTGRRIVYVALGAEFDDLSDLAPTARERSRRRQEVTGVATLYPKSSFEYQILPEIAPRTGELVVNKTTLGAFSSTTLEQTLRNLGIRNLVVTGVVTSVCVESTARDAVDRGFATVLVSDACAAWDQESQEATLRSFRRYFGRVATTSDVFAETRARAGSVGDTNG